MMIIELISIPNSWTHNYYRGSSCAKKAQSYRIEAMQRRPKAKE